MDTRYRRDWQLLFWSTDYTGIQAYIRIRTLLSRNDSCQNRALEDIHTPSFRSVPDRGTASVKSTPSRSSKWCCLGCCVVSASPWRIPTLRKHPLPARSFLSQSTASTWSSHPGRKRVGRRWPVLYKQITKMALFFFSCFLRLCRNKLILSKFFGFLRCEWWAGS